PLARRRQCVGRGAGLELLETATGVSPRVDRQDAKTPVRGRAPRSESIRSLSPTGVLASWRSWRSLALAGPRAAEMTTSNRERIYAPARAITQLVSRLREARWGIVSMLERRHDSRREL